MVLLKSKGDIISKIFSILGQNETLLTQLVEWAKINDSNTQ